MKQLFQNTYELSKDYLILVLFEHILLKNFWSSLNLTETHLMIILRLFNQQLLSF